MKKTITTLALMASSQALAFPAPHNPSYTQTYCLKTYVQRDHSLVGTCDETENNRRQNRKLLANGCAARQVALELIGPNKIESCLPPGVVQL